MRRRALHHRYGRASNGAVQAAPWPADEARHHAAIARQLFREKHYDSDHARNPDPDNCGACAMRLGGAEGPNYAGWARIYIEAQQPIPKKWERAFQAELDSDNQAYSNALRRSIATFGGPKFR